MSASSQTAQTASGVKGFVLTEGGAVRAGEERTYPLNKLKASPDNVRKGGHGAAVIEARAASILANGLIQLPVVKPERGPDGSETGYALVTAGESRRLALRLLAKRKLIPKTALVRCLVDEANDAGEVSLAENFAREPVMAVQVFVVLIEFKISTLIGFALVPFGLFGRTAFMAERVLGAVIATGVKVMALAVVVGIGSTLFDQFVQTWQGGQPTLEQVLALVLASLVLLGLSIFCPGIASGLMSGAPQLGLGAAVGTGLTVGGLAVAGAAVTQMAVGAGAGLAAKAALAGGGRPPPGGNGGGGNGPPSPANDPVPPWRPPSAPAASPLPANDETAPGPKTAKNAAPGASGAAAPAPSGEAGSSANGAAEADGQANAPPRWARELKHHQQLAHGASLTAHALASGDDHGTGASPSLSEQ